MGRSRETASSWPRAADHGIYAVGAALHGLTEELPAIASPLRHNGSPAANKNSPRHCWAWAQKSERLVRDWEGVGDPDEPAGRRGQARLRRGDGSAAVGCRPAAGALIGDRAVAQFGSALDWGSSGRRFKSCQPDAGQRVYLELPKYFQ